jgi:hypothetical protein
MMVMLRTITAILLIFCHLPLKSTIQVPDLLILGSDTIKIHIFPLDILAKENPAISTRFDEIPCMTTDCWRQHIGIWMIEGDRLFLTALTDCCDDKDIPLNKIFDDSEIRNGKVFAGWYSGRINAGFGKFLGFDRNKLENVFEFNLDLTINKGKVEKCIINRIQINTFEEQKSEMIEFFLGFYNSDRNNAEMAAVHNEKLFSSTRSYPLAAMTAFCEQEKEVQDFLISEYLAPIHDQVDLQLIYSLLSDIKSPCSDAHRITDALKTAMEKY